jgi:hypothetical protein
LAALQLGRDQPVELRPHEAGLDHPGGLARAVRVRVDEQVTVAGDEVVDQGLVPLEPLVFEQGLAVLGDLVLAAESAAPVVGGSHGQPPWPVS